MFIGLYYLATREYLEADINLPEERVHDLADHIMKHATCCVSELRRLFLVEDMVDSIKVC